MPVSDADIAAAAQVTSAAINYAGAASANRKGRKWAEEQYARERQDAIADREFQNQFNSPAAQMERLKAAGLNPNLVYGDGAQTPSVITRGASAQWKPDAPRLDLSGAANSIMAATQLRNTEAQTDNLKAQNALIKQQEINTAANTQNVGATTARSEFDLQQLKATASTDVAIKEATLGKTIADKTKTEADTSYTLAQNERAALLNNQTLLKGMQEIANLKTTGTALRQGIKNQQTQNAIAELDRALKEKGLQTHDPLYARMAAEAIKKIPSPKEFKTWVDKTIKQLLPAGTAKPSKRWF